MKVAYVGTMGIPAHYGGFETCVDEVATRLVARGHDVTVYCGYKGSKEALKSYKGVHLKYVPCLKNKFTDFPFRALVSTLDLLRKDYDIVHFFGSDAWPYTLLPRILSKKTILTLDGLVWKRLSYPIWVRQILRLTTNLALVFPNATTSDSKFVQSWYFENFGRSPIYVPYGANVDLEGPDLEVLNKYGLKNGHYFLFVGRLVQEKGVHYLVEAFSRIKTDFKLVIVGGDPYGKDYETYLKKIASANTAFLGYIYGKEYESLCKGAYLYVTPSQLEGTSPALLTAMALKKCVLVSDIPENLETIGDAGVSFKNGNVSDLEEKLRFLLKHPEIVNQLQMKAVDRVSHYYDWNKITDQLEEIYLQHCTNGSDARSTYSKNLTVFAHRIRQSFSFFHSSETDRK